MNLWALADLHLSFGTPNKSMEVFGPKWNNWTDKIFTSCHRLIKPDDLLLIPGDISWALTLEEASVDLLWIASLPGTKLLLKGNHDYWWPSKAKLHRILPPSVHVIHHDAFHRNNISIAGARLWDTPEYNFDSIIEIKENPASSKPPVSKEELLRNEEKIFQKELIRLKMSLEQLAPSAEYRIVMTHYPPIGLDLKPSRVSTLLDTYNVDCCVFGHLHNVIKSRPLFGKAHKTTYYLTSCDYLEFSPIKIL